MTITVITRSNDHLEFAATTWTVTEDRVELRDGTRLVAEFPFGAWSGAYHTGDLKNHVRGQS